MPKQASVKPIRGIAHSAFKRVFKNPESRLEVTMHYFDPLNLPTIFARRYRQRTKGIARISVQTRAIGCNLVANNAVQNAVAAPALQIRRFIDPRRTTRSIDWLCRVATARDWRLFAAGSMTCLAVRSPCSNSTATAPLPQIRPSDWHASVVESSAHWPGHDAATRRTNSSTIDAKFPASSKYPRAGRLWH